MIFCVWKPCAFLSYKLLLFPLELLLFWMLNQIKSWVKWEVLILKIPLFLNCGESTILTFSIPCLGTCGSIASHVQGGWRTWGPAAWGPSCHWSWARLAWGAEAGGQLICSPPLRINGKMLTSGTSEPLLCCFGLEARSADVRRTGAERLWGRVVKGIAWKRFVLKQWESKGPAVHL